MFLDLHFGANISQSKKPLQELNISFSTNKVERRYPPPKPPYLSHCDKDLDYRAIYKNKLSLTHPTKYD